MNAEQILRVLRNERECIQRQGWSNGNVMLDGIIGHCDRNCAKCDLCLPDTEILEVYDFLIHGYELIERQGADSYMLKIDIPEDKKDDLLEKLQSASTRNIMLMNDDKSFKPMPLPGDMIVQHKNDNQ